MKNIILYISFSLLSILTFACNEEKKVINDSQKVEITLSDKIVVDEVLNISYQIPQGWNKMPAALSEKFVARLGGKNKYNLIIYSPKSFYYNDNSSSLLRVGKVSLKDKSVPGLLTLGNYFELFKRYNSKLLIERNDIHLNQLEIMELKIEKGNLISFKIVFYNRAKEIIQLDFSITKENISKLKPSIDASIKSIKLL